MDWRKIIKNKWVYIALSFIAATVGMFLEIVSPELWAGFVGTLIAGNFVVTKIAEKKKDEADMG